MHHEGFLEPPRGERVVCNDICLVQGWDEKDVLIEQDISWFMVALQYSGFWPQDLACENSTIEQTGIVHLVIFLVIIITSRPLFLMWWNVPEEDPGTLSDISDAREDVGFVFWHVKDVKVAYDMTWHILDENYNRLISHTLLPQSEYHKILYWGLSIECWDSIGINSLLSYKIRPFVWNHPSGTMSCWSHDVDWAWMSTTSCTAAIRMWVWYNNIYLNQLFGMRVLWNSHLTTIFHFVIVCYCLALWTIL